MDRALSTHLFVQQHLTTALLAKIADSGIPYVELFCARQHLDYRDAGQVNELKHWFRDSSLIVRSVHSPIYNDDIWGRSGPEAAIRITERNKARRIQHVDEIKRALEMAESLPFRYLVQHLGGPNEEYTEWGEEAAFNSLDELSVFARQRGVEILLENIPNEYSTPSRLVSFLERTHLELGFVLDTGHANLDEGIEPAFTIMKNRLRSTHIHDNDGLEDLHLFPMDGGKGNIDWQSTIGLLRSRQDQYPLLLELRDPENLDNPLVSANLVFERLESL